jgi:hypothetical protein
MAPIATISSIFKSLFNGDLEESSTHAWLFGAAIIGSALVALGILLESHWPFSRMKFREKLGIILVVLGVVIEASFTFALLTFDEGLSRSQKSQIIELESRLAARQLSDTEVSEIQNRLRQFAPAPFQIIPYWDDPESKNIADRIAFTLGTIGWRLENPERYTIIPGVIAGVIVNVDSRASDNARGAARELAAALAGNHIVAVEKERPDTTTNPPSEGINLQVGIKP